MKLTKEICGIDELVDAYYGDKSLYFRGWIDISFGRALDIKDDGEGCLDLALMIDNGDLSVDIVYINKYNIEDWYCYSPDKTEKEMLLDLVTDFLGCTPKQWFKNREKET